jgi:hypothetical protein
MMVKKLDVQMKHYLEELSSAYCEEIADIQADIDSGIYKDVQELENALKTIGDLQRGLDRTLTKLRDHAQL